MAKMGRMAQVGNIMASPFMLPGYIAGAAGIGYWGANAMRGNQVAETVNDFPAEHNQIEDLRAQDRQLMVAAQTGVVPNTTPHTNVGTFQVPAEVAMKEAQRLQEQQQNYAVRTIVAEQGRQALLDRARAEALYLTQGGQPVA